jgi:hypothetical protein
MVSFGPRNAFEGAWEPLGRVVFGAKSLRRFLRVTRPVTRLLGPEYRRSRDLIEVDITYSCNLGCANCNRSCRQAPSDERMTIGQIEAFVDESRARREPWRRIRVLGGEPTLHPSVLAILEIVRGAFDTGETIVELVTNGRGPAAERVLRSLPAGVDVDNSHKAGPMQLEFRPFNVAPRDLLRHRLSAFENACQVASVCGMGLSPFGYYCCAVAAAIDRVFGFDIGRQTLPGDEDDMLDQARVLCRLCGRFLDGHFVPHNLRRPLSGEPVSHTWRKEYDRYADSPPSLTRYAQPLGRTESIDA